MAKIAEVADLIMGQSPPSSTYNEAGNGLAFFQGKSDFGFRHPTPRLYCSEPLKVAKPHDILMSVRAPVGPTNIADQECCIGRGLAAIRARTIDGNFLFFNLRYIEKLIASLGTGSTFQAINKTQLGAVEVNAPDFDLPEQQKIAGVLGVVQRAIEQQDQLLQKTTELKKTLLHKLFTEGLRGEPQKETEIGPVPESWEVTRLDKFCVLQRGFDITKKEQMPGGVPVVSSGGISSYHNVPKVKGPGVVIGRKGTLGKVHYLDVDYWPHDTTLWVKDFKGYDPLFTSYFLKTLRFERFNSGASNPTLNRNTVHAELVAYPNEEEQREIGLILKSVEDKAHIQERKRQALTALFRTLLHQLMTAQIRVNEIELPGEALTLTLSQRAREL